MITWKITLNCDLAGFQESKSAVGDCGSRGKAGGNQGKDGGAYLEPRLSELLWRASAAKGERRLVSLQRNLWGKSYDGNWIFYAPETSVIEIQPDEFEDEVGNSYESDTQYVDEGQQFDSDDDEEEEEFVVENWETSETERRAQRQASKGKQKAKLLPCPMCPQKFAKSSVLSRHIHKRHRKEFVCKVCGMTFGRKDYFMVHVKCHVGYQVEDDDDSPADRKSMSLTLFSEGWFSECNP